MTVTFRKRLHVGDGEGTVRIPPGEPVDLVSWDPDGPNVVRLTVRSDGRTLQRSLFISEVRGLIRVAG